jgi:hypothetical protein
MHIGDSEARKIVDDWRATAQLVREIWERLDAAS